MPIHDWTQVDAGIFHAFHHGWIEELARALNRGVLPSSYYALPEELPAWLDVTGTRLEKPWAVTVRCEENDRAVAIVKIVTPGEKASRTALVRFAERVRKHFDLGMHLLLVDVAAATASYPLYIHEEIWRAVADERYRHPSDKPLALVSYHVGKVVEAYVEPVSIGDVLADMPLFLAPQQTVAVALEATYNVAIAEMPRRWRRVLEPTTK